MSEFKDHFSSQSQGYSLFRPHYPDELYASVASYCKRHQLAWDCGCGTGQASHGLIRHFAKVIATDGSSAQIERAVADEKIEYRVATAEASGIAAATVDLVLVAQALHWFDFDRFYQEVERVGRPGGVLAAIAYGLMRIAPGIDSLIDRLYYDLLGSCWPPERAYIDNGYRSIPFPFPLLPLGNFEMSAEWSCEHCLGYLETWSAVQRYREQNSECPVALIAGDLRAAWGSPSARRRVCWPLYGKVGRIG